MDSVCISVLIGLSKMLKLVGILSLVSVTFAAVARFPPQEKPPQFADQEGCYIKYGDLEKVLPYDQPYYDGKCQKYLCQSSNNETLLETCGAVAIRPGCRKSDNDLTKNYPACCGTEVCDETTVAPTTTQAPTTPPANPGYAYASASAQAGNPPPTTTEAATTPTTEVPTTAVPTTQVPTTAVPTTQVPTTGAPTTPPTYPGSYASASAQSGGGQPPVTSTYTSGPGADASATAS